MKGRTGWKSGARVDISGINDEVSSFFGEVLRLTSSILSDIVVSDRALVRTVLSSLLTTIEESQCAG